MFNNVDELSPYATPERVFALYNFVRSYGPVSAAGIRELLEPLNDISGSYTPECINVGKELGIINSQNGKYQIAFTLDNIDAFRQHAARIAFTPTTAFFRFSAFLLRKTAQDLAVKYNQIEFESTVRDREGWRFWAEFFGLGIFNGMVYIANAGKRIEYALEDQPPDGMDIGIEAPRFIDWIRNTCPELMENLAINERLSMAVSNGLRYLHDVKVIHMENRPDAQTRLLLQIMNQHELNEMFTHVALVR